MKIIYTENPLRSIVELDEKDHKILRLAVENDYIKDLATWAFMDLEEVKSWFPGVKKIRNIKAARSHLDICHDVFDAKMDARASTYVEDLKGIHDGDCICQPCTCSKCLAESYIGADSIPGLRKHEANYIYWAFKESGEPESCSKAIQCLKDNPPVVKEDWHNAHIERWTGEHKRALEWLEQYQKDHL